MNFFFTEFCFQQTESLKLLQVSHFQSVERNAPKIVNLIMDTITLPESVVITRPKDPMQSSADVETYGGLEQILNKLSIYQNRNQ